MPVSSAAAQPLPSRAVTLSRILVRLRSKMEQTKRRTWFELQRTHYYTNPPAIRTTAELAAALVHFHVTLGEDELRLLMQSFVDEQSGGFSFRALSARLYPMDRQDGWGFERRDEVVASERLHSGARKAQELPADSISALPASTFAATASAFPVVFAATSSTTASSNAKPATASFTTAAAAKLSTARAKYTAAAASKRPATAAPAASSGRPTAASHHSSRYVKQPTAIGRVYSERVFDSGERESQRTAYVKYVNEGHWVRV